MDKNFQIERLLTDGYLIVGPVIPIANLYNSISKFLAVFDISDSRQTLLDPRNRDKTLIMLKHPSTKQRIQIITSDVTTINKALAQRRYQEEPIGLLIRAQCSALGGRSSDERVFHLDQLIPSIDGLWNWHFKLGKTVGTFEAIKRLETTNSFAAEKDLDSLSHLLGSLAYIYQVGFFIQHSTISKILRMETTVSWGPEERMLSAITKKEVQDIESLLASPEAIVAIKGLNQAYIENCMPSRLSMLWSAVEQVFSSRSEPLLNKKEIEALLKAADKIESLKADNKRLTNLSEALKNPDRLPLKSRNLRMAEAIASVLKMDFNMAYSKVKKASEMRGKNVHSLAQSWKDIKESEAFLQKALLAYIAATQVSKQE